MRTITIQADGPHLDDIMEGWLAHLVRAIPVGPHGITFDGGLHDGTIVNHRSEGEWTVSFRRSRNRAYSNPAVVARVIIVGEQDESAVIPAMPARDVTASVLSGTGCTGMEARGAVRNARPTRRGRRPGPGRRGRAGGRGPPKGAAARPPLGASLHTCNAPPPGTGRWPARAC